MIEQTPNTINKDGTAFNGNNGVIVIGVVLYALVLLAMFV